MRTVLAEAGVTMAAGERVLLIGNFLSSSGASRSVMEDLEERLRSTYRLTCASHYRPGWKRGLHMVWTAIRHCTRYEVAVIDLYSDAAFLWGEAVGIILSLLRRPAVLVLRGGSLPDFAKRHPRRLKACLSRAAVVCAPSDYLRERMLAYRPDVELLPNPVPVGRYPFRLRSDPSPRIVWLRAFHEIFNPELAPEVLRLLTDEFPGASLQMFGAARDGSVARTRATAERLGVANQVSMPGPLPKNQIPEALNEGDIFLNTTNVDNTPVSVLEAMACGLCIVSTNVGGVPYLLEHDHDALLTPPNDAPAMAAAIRRILTEPGLAEKLSRNARAKAEQFDWSVVLPRWEQVLAAAAQSGM
jgi:glycosyltransferase involved in cell wall biosynthesis